MKKVISHEPNLREISKKNRRCLLDTNFILTCIRQKIDFFEQLEKEGFQIIIPRQVIRELKKLEAELALNLLKKNKFKKINLKGKNTDNGIVNFAKKNPKIVIATLDREIKKKIKNPKLIIRRKKKLEII